MKHRKIFSGKTLIKNSLIVLLCFSLMITPICPIYAEQSEAQPQGAVSEPAKNVSSGEVEATKETTKKTTSATKALSSQPVGTFGSYTATVDVALDDAEEYGTAKTISSGDDMQIGGYWQASLTPANKQISAFRFPAVQIPDNANITNAYLEFTTYRTANAANKSNIVVRTEVGNPTRYTTTRGMLSARTYSDIAIRYQQAAFTASKQKVRTPNLKSIIDDRRLNGWQNGQALAFMFDGDNFIGGVYQGASTYRPKLVIEYEYMEDNFLDSTVTNPRSLNSIYINEVAPFGTTENTGAWVELYNDNDFPVVLNDEVFLGTQARPNQQKFSYFMIPAKGFRTVEATDVSLTASAITLSILNGSSYAAIDEMALEGVAAGETWGRFNDGSDELVRYIGGTYASTNESIAPEINYTISHATGTYEDAFQAVIKTDTVNKVTYTLNRSVPSATNGIVYTGPISIAENQAIDLKVFVSNERSSIGPLSYTYIVGAATANLHQFKASKAIVTGNDDASVSPSSVNLTSTSMYLNGLNGSTANDNYIRFAALDLPEDAIITNAYIEFTTYATTKPTQIAVSGEVSNGAAFTNNLLSFTGRNFSSPTAQMKIPATQSGQKIQTENVAELMNGMRQHNASLNDFVFKITGDKSGALRVRSYNYGVASAPTLHYEYYSMYGKFTQTITDRYNDAEEYGTSNVISINDDMQIGGYWSTSLTPAYLQKAAFRFTNVDLPQDAEIVDAYMEFTTYATTTASRISNQTIKLEQGNPGAYTTAAGNVGVRSQGILSVKYQQSAFTAARQIVRTPDLGSLINENRLRGWQSGQSLAFVMTGDNYVGSVYQGSTAYAPRLIVKYRFTGNDSTADLFDTDQSKLDNLFINEVSSQGSASSKEDWIEIYNDNDSTVVLGYHAPGQPLPATGFKLWRDTNRKESYAFNNLIIPAKGFRIIYFDESPEDGSEHADFDLKKNAELVLYSDADGSERIVHSFKYPEHVYNQTYGLRVDGGSQAVLFANETFGETNARGQEKYALTVSHDRGVYPQGFDLSAESKPGTTIRYTTDGTNPTTARGAVYSRPIPISRSCMVKFFAYDDTGNSTINTYTYVLQNNYPNELARFVSGVQNGNLWRYKNTITAGEYAQAIAEVPIVSVSANQPKIMPNADYVKGTFEYIDSHLDGENYVADVGLKKYGNVSMTQHNGNLGIRFHRDYNSVKAEYKFFEIEEGAVIGSGEYPRLDLKEGQDGPQADVFNLGYLRYDEKVTQTLSGQMGKLNLDTKYVHSFYNGEYMGLKTMVEHFNDNMMEEYFGGDSDDYSTIEYNDGYFTTGFIEPGDGDMAVNRKVLNLASTKNFQEFKKHVDVDDMIKTQIMFMFIDTEREIDGVIENTAGDGKSMKMKFNINDTDGAFYNNGRTGTVSSAFAGGGGNYRFKWIDATSRFGAGRMFGHFSGDSTSVTAGNLEFKTLVKDQVLTQIGPISGDMKGAPGAPLSVDNVRSVLKQNQDELKNLYKLDAAFMSTYSDMYVRWTRANGNVLAQVDDRVKHNLEMWKKYNMAHTLSPAKVVKGIGGVTLSNPNSGTAVYYTLDGSDPMGANGVISPSAQIYRAGDILPADANLTVRCFTTNNWGPVSNMPQ